MIQPGGLQRSLLRWFDRAKRPLPWRANRDPYSIWVSEAMLQQTTVATVIPYFERFIKRFPTLASLAAATEDSVVAQWSGLGYYSRARNLRLGAQQVIATHRGHFPRSVEEALTLPGVGRYTASAVTSIAYGTPAAVVDGNVRRVLSRLFAKRALSPSTAQGLADDLLAANPGKWNEAMMELGATVCTPQAPSCPRCPVRRYCRGRDDPQHWSAKPPARPSVRVVVNMALVVRRGRILLARNAPGGLMSGLHDLPHSGYPSRQRRAQTPLAVDSTLTLDPKPIATVRHTVTHHRLEAFIFKAKVADSALPERAAFISIREIESIPVGALTRKALRAAGLLSR